VVGRPAVHDLESRAPLVEANVWPLPSPGGSSSDRPPKARAPLRANPRRSAATASLPTPVALSAPGIDKRSAGCRGLFSCGFVLTAPDDALTIHQSDVDLAALEFPAAKSLPPLFSAKTEQIPSAGKLRAPKRRAGHRGVKVWRVWTRHRPLSPSEKHRRFLKVQHHGTA